MKKIYLLSFILIAGLILAILVTTNSKWSEQLNASTEAADLKPSKNAQDIPVLMYHILLEGQNDSISVDPERFEEHMSAIKAAGYTTITDFELAEHLERDSPLPEKPILITFDDGYKSNYTEAFPVLKELDMKATIYVIASRIFESPSTLYADEHEKITWRDARAMQGTITIQGHTWDSHYKDTNVENELRGVITGPMDLGAANESQADFEERVLADFLISKETIEEEMGYEVVSLAYPYGEYSADTVRLAEQAGYKMAFTTQSGVVNRETAQPFELKRITANGAFSGEELLAEIEGAQ